MKTTTNLFEFATRNKLRFESSRGVLSAEQLWDVPLRGGDFNLDAIAKGANRTLKALTEESFVETERTPSVAKAEATLEVVKYVIATKVAEDEAAKVRAANRAEKAKLLEILAEKQDGKLSSLSEAELKRRIAALGE